MNKHVLQRKFTNIQTFAEELADLFGVEATSNAWWRHDWSDEERPDSNSVPPALDE